jgi:light-regulated signal transduction histidine kinase (bacteriophytochrome)
MKGLYFLGVDLRGADVFHEYIFTSFHLEHLEAHRIFQDHVQLEEMYHRLLKQTKHNSDLMSLLYTLELHKLPFAKRRLVPQI